jgi:hypothetical protein
VGSWKFLSALDSSAEQSYLYVLALYSCDRLISLFAACFAEFLCLQCRDFGVLSLAA